MQLKTVADLAALVRDRRRALGWTQQELAARTGASTRWVVDLESGKASVRTGMALRVLAALGVSLDAAVRTDTAGAELDAFLDELSDGG